MVWSRLKASWAFVQTNHYAHIATKPAQSLLILGGLHLVFGWALGLSAGLSLVVPTVISGARKAYKWKGSMGTDEGVMDLVADTVAAATVIIPLLIGGWAAGVVFAAGVLWLALGGHEHSKP